MEGPRWLSIVEDQNMNIANRVCLITGGASGLGAATAKMALDAGARVVIADMNAPREGWAQAEWEGRWVHVKTDVSTEASGQAAVQMAMERFGRLDVLVNAAGIASAEKILTKNGPASLEAFTRTITINLIGTFNMMRLAVPADVREATQILDTQEQVLADASRSAQGIVERAEEERARLIEENAELKTRLAAQPASPAPAALPPAYGPQAGGYDARARSSQSGAAPTGGDQQGGMISSPASG